MTFSDVPLSRSIIKFPFEFGNATVESTSSVVDPEIIKDTTRVFGCI